MPSLKELQDAGKIAKGPRTYSGSDFNGIAKARDKFDVTGGQYGNDANGDYHIIEAVWQRSKEPFAMKFRSNPQRDAAHLDILEAAAEGPVTDCRLAQLNDNEEFPLYGIVAA